MLDCFPFLGFISNKSKIKFKFGIIFQIFLIWFNFAIRLIIPWESSDLYKMSFYFTVFVFFFGSFSATIALIESFQTINIEIYLRKILFCIDLHLNNIHEIDRVYFKKKYYLLTLIICSVSYIVIATIGPFEGTYLYYMYPVSLIKLRIFQITLWIEKCFLRVERFRQKLEKPWQFRNKKAVLSNTKIVLLFLDLQTSLHKCFESSLMFIIICFLLDFICSIYWFLLPFLKLLTFHFWFLCITSLVSIGLQFSILLNICQQINIEVNF